MRTPTPEELGDALGRIAKQLRKQFPEEYKKVDRYLSHINRRQHYVVSFEEIQEMEHDLERERIRYDHDATCTKTRFSPLNERGIKTCHECAGKFDADGNGVFVNDKRFDANYVPPTTP